MNIVRKLRLRAGSPLWMASGTNVPRASTAARSFATEVLVVGAGISGSLVAHALAAQGRRVTVVDRRGVLLGSTPASTALLQFENDDLANACDLTRRIMGIGAIGPD